MAMRFHTVRAGETLSGIAQALGHKDWTDLGSLNGLSDPNMIRPGEVIMVPVEDSPDDKLRVSAAKAAPAAEAVRAARPSQARPKSVPVEVVEDPAPRKRGRQPNEPFGELKAIKPGNIPTSYDPNSASRFGDMNYWGDVLQQNLPEIASLVYSRNPMALARRNAQNTLRDFAEYPYPEPNASRFNFNRKAARTPTQDPNYYDYQLPENRLPQAKPSERDVIAEKAALRWPRYGRAYREGYEPNDVPRSDARSTGKTDADRGPSLGDFMAALGKQFGYPGSPYRRLGDETDTLRPRMTPLHNEQERLMQGADRSYIPSGPGGDVPKNPFIGAAPVHPMRSEGSYGDGVFGQESQNTLPGGTVVDFEQGKKKLLEGGYAPRGGGAKGGDNVRALPVRPRPAPQRTEVQAEAKIRAEFEAWAAKINKIQSPEDRALAAAQWHEAWTNWNNGLDF